MANSAVFQDKFSAACKELGIAVSLAIKIMGLILAVYSLARTV